MGVSAATAFGRHLEMKRGTPKASDDGSITANSACDTWEIWTMNEYVFQLYYQLPESEPDPEAWLDALFEACLLYTSPSPRDATLSRMPSSA